MNSNTKELKLMWNTWSDGPKKLLVSPLHRPRVAEFTDELSPDDVVELDVLELLEWVKNYPYTVGTFIACTSMVAVNYLQQARLDLDIKWYRVKELPQ